jgi:hypothetical protein
LTRKNSTFILVLQEEKYNMNYQIQMTGALTSRSGEKKIMILALRLLEGSATTTTHGRLSATTGTMNNAIVVDIVSPPDLPCLLSFTVSLYNHHGPL